MLNDLNDLVTKISDLETKSLATEPSTILLEPRKKLQSILNQNAQKILFLKKGFFYNHGDKTGKFLARALKDAQLPTNIS